MTTDLRLSEEDARMILAEEFERLGEDGYATATLHPNHAQSDDDIILAALAAEHRAYASGQRDMAERAAAALECEAVKAAQEAMHFRHKTARTVPENELNLVLARRHDGRKDVLKSAVDVVRSLKQNVSAGKETAEQQRTNSPVIGEMQPNRETAGAAPQAWLPNLGRRPECKVARVRLRNGHEYGPCEHYRWSLRKHYDDIIEYLPAREGQEDKDLDRTTRQSDDRVEQRQTVTQQEIVGALKRYVDDYDPEAVSPDAGCIECTLGTVPNNLNSGLCKYHNAKEVLACTLIAPPLGAAQRSRSDEVLAERKEESTDATLRIIVDAIRQSANVFKGNPSADTTRAMFEYCVEVIEAKLRVAGRVARALAKGGV